MMVAAASSPLERRVLAAQATLDRFKDQPFAWGRFDCARMVAFHLRQMGYRPRMPAAGTYRSALTGYGALKRAGYARLADALDGLGFARIAPAAALVGDIIEGPADDAGENPFGAMSVALGNGAICGYHPDFAGAIAMRPLAFVAAWRVDPR